MLFEELLRIIAVVARCSRVHKHRRRRHFLIHTARRLRLTISHHPLSFRSLFFFLHFYVLRSALLIVPCTRHARTHASVQKMRTYGHITERFTTTNEWIM